MLVPRIARLVPAAAIVFDVGAHAGQYTNLFARAAAQGRVYAFEPGSYARSILRTVVWLHGLANVAVLPMALGAVSRRVTHHHESAPGIEAGLEVPLAAFKFAHGGPSIEIPPREMGADNEAVLGELGYAAGEIAALRAAGAI